MASMQKYDSTKVVSKIQKEKSVIFAKDETNEEKSTPSVSPTATTPLLIEESDYSDCKVEFAHQNSETEMNNGEKSVFLSAGEGRKKTMRAQSIADI